MPVMLSSGRFGAQGIKGLIESRNLTTGLVLCLDAADELSYTSGQSWLDRSGGGYDFFRGTNNTSEGSDPTFNGTPGGQTASEFWNFDGADFFKYDTTVETWMTNLHADNATFSYIAGVYLPSGTPTFYLFDTMNASTQRGVRVTVGTTAKHTCDVRNTAGGLARQIVSSATPSTSAWNFVGLSLDEASATSGVIKVNGTTDTGLSVTYSSPSASAATPMLIGATNDGAFQSVDTRIAFLAIWSTAIGATALNNLYADIKAARAYGF